METKREKREMNSHGSVSAAVAFCFAWAMLAATNNVSLKRHPSWSFAELTTFCWGKVCQTRFRAAKAAEHRLARRARLISTRMSASRLNGCLCLAVRDIAFVCEAAAAHHPDRLRNALFEGFYDGGFFLVLVVLYGTFKQWYVQYSLTAANNFASPARCSSCYVQGRVKVHIAARSKRGSCYHVIAVTRQARTGTQPHLPPIQQPQRRYQEPAAARL